MHFRPLLLAIFLGSVTLTVAFSRADPVTPYPFELEFQTRNGWTSLADENQDKTVVLSFIFTDCAGFCPLQTASLAAVQDGLSDQVKSKSRFVSVSLAPFWDGVDDVDAYADNHLVDQGHWAFGVPVQEQLDATIASLGLQVRASDQEGQLDHSMIVYLLQPGGNVAMAYQGNAIDVSRVISDVTGFANQNNPS